MSTHRPICRMSALALVVILGPGAQPGRCLGHARDRHGGERASKEGAQRVADHQEGGRRIC